MRSIPFKISDVFMDLAEVEGMLSLEGDNLIIEYQTKDGILGILKTQLKELRISVGDLDSIEYRKKVLKGLVDIRGKKMSVFANFPGSQHGNIRLKINKDHRDAAEQFVEDVSLRISEYKVRHIDDDLLS